MSHPKVKVKSQCGWFYIIQLSHNGKWGFGITLNAESRLRKGYCNPSAEKQFFAHLYYGRYNEIKALERHLKNQWQSKMLVLYKEKLEWFDPIHGIDGNQIVSFVETRCKAVYPEIYRVKSKYLPFSPGSIFKDIKNAPEKFLEKIT